MNRTRMLWNELMDLCEHVAEQDREFTEDEVGHFDNIFAEIKQQIQVEKGIMKYE